MMTTIAPTPVKAPTIAPTPEPMRRLSPGEVCPNQRRHIPDIVRRRLN